MTELAMVLAVLQSQAFKVGFSHVDECDSSRNLKEIVKPCNWIAAFSYV